MRRICSIIFSLCVTVSLVAQVIPNLYRQVSPGSASYWVDSVYATMTLDEKIGQLFMLVVDPSIRQSNTQAIRKQLSAISPGGILFSKGTVDDQIESTNLYQKESRIPLLISLDGEWGLSMRLQNTTRFPRNMMLGAITNEKYLELYGQEVARQCREAGIQINFAPVLDVNSNANNPVIGNRSFGENPVRVMHAGLAYAKGLEDRGVMAVAKHFPGHGDTAEDSHYTTPVVSHDKETLTAVDLLPFRAYIDAGFSGLMTGHLSVPSLDSQTGLPASLSPLIASLVKDTLGFDGLLFTDALVMKGASAKENVCVQAILADNDVLLSPGKPVTDFNAVKKAVEDGVIPLQVIEQKCKKILQYKYVLGLNQYEPVGIKNINARLNTDSAEWISQRLCNESVTLLKNTAQLLPLQALDEKTIASVSIGEDGISDFQKMLKKYAKVDAFVFDEKAKPEELEKKLKQMEKYDVIICGVHSAKQDGHPVLRKLAGYKNVIYSFFFIPYSLTSFQVSVDSAQAVVMAYENSSNTQSAAAQAIMGGISFAGKLPVSVAGMFREGEGMMTERIRLSYQRPPEVNMSAQKLKEIEKIAREGIREKAFPGCQVLVAKNGVVVYDKTFGFFDYANTHPVETTDVYDLASVTKVTATLPAVMKLYDEKKIGLTDRLSRFVDELKHTDKEDITVKEALFHESGLTPFLPFYQQAIDKNSYEGRLFSSKRDLNFRILYDDNTYGRTDFKYLPNLVSETKKKGFNLQVADHFYLSDTFKTLILKEIVGSNLRKKNAYLYSDLNFMLLKEAVEEISRTNIDQYLNERFYRCLGMNYTSYLPLAHGMDVKKIAPTEDDEMLRNQLLIGYVHDEAAAFMGGVSGNAGLFSNANDLAKLCQMFLNKGTYGGTRFFSENTSELFTATVSKNSRRGLGFDKPDPARKPDFLPASVYGHTGFTGTAIWIDPENQLIYIFLSNRVYPSRTYKNLSRLNIRERIQEVIYGAMEDRSETSKK